MRSPKGRRHYPSNSNRRNASRFPVFRTVPKVRRLDRSARVIGSALAITFGFQTPCLLRVVEKTGQVSRAGQECRPVSVNEWVW